MRFLTYDILLPEPDAALKRKYRAALWVVPLLFALLGLAAIFILHADNMSGPATASLLMAVKISQHFKAWFHEGFWYSFNTPAPLYRTALAVLFRLFGYAPSYAMAVTCLLSVVASLAIGAVACRRFGLIGGLLAQILYVSNPLVVKMSVSSGAYIWGLAPVFVAIDLLDRYDRTKQRRFYYAAAFALLCSGMSRPENFILTLAPLLLVSAPLLARVLFGAIVGSYPVLNTLYMLYYGLKAPDAWVGREVETLNVIFMKWAHLSGRLLVENLAGPHWVILAIGMLLIGAFTRTRFLSLISLLLWPLFCAIDLMSWGEPYFAHHYYLVSAFLLLFAAGGMIEISRIITPFAAQRLSPKGIRIVYALIGIGIMLAFTPVGRAKAIVAGLTGQVSPEAREARTFVNKEAAPSDSVIVDCTGEVTWLCSEFYNDKREVWAYNSPHPRPFYENRKDEESIRLMNSFIAGSLKSWIAVKRPVWMVAQSEKEWTRVKDNPFQRMFCLRPVLELDSLHDGCEIPMGSFTLQLKRECENPLYTVYRLKYAQSIEIKQPEPRNALLNTDFREWQGSTLKAWMTLYGTKAVPVGEDAGTATVELRAASPEKTAALVQSIENPAHYAGRKARASLWAWSATPAMMGMNIYYWDGGKRKVDMLFHPGDGQWHELTAIVSFPETLSGKPIDVLIANRANTGSPARIRSVALQIQE